MLNRKFSSLSSRAPLAVVGMMSAAALVLSACGTDGGADDNGEDSAAPSAVTTTVTAADGETPTTLSEPAATAPDGNGDDAPTVTVTVPPEPAGQNSPTAPPPLGSPDLAQKRRDPEGDRRLAVVDVRVAEHERFDRVVFDLEGSGSPGWIMDYTTEPRQQGSGLPIEYDGSVALQVGIDGTPYPFDVEPEPMGLGPVTGANAGAVTGVNFATIFEGRSEFVIGLEQQMPYSVTLLENPTRIVIDFAGQ